jgi:hypothetical protein
VLDIREKIAVDEQRESEATPVLGRMWYRSDGYVLEDGMLCLKPGASLEAYDPWEAWRSSPDEKRPYKSLLRIVQRIETIGLRSAPHLRPRQGQLLEQWVRHNGLLGILPHETLEVTMGTRWMDEQRTHLQPASEPAGISVLVPVQRRSERAPFGWRRSFPRPAYAREVDPALEGELVSAERLGADWLPVEALYRRLPEGKLERRPLNQHWHGFFPQVPDEQAETYAYPGPGTPEFWQSYSEGLGLFVGMAKYLAGIVQALEPLQQGEALDEQQKTIAWRGLSRLNAFAAAVQPAATLSEKNRVRIAWSSPSLLGCFAVMLLSDLAAGQLIRACPNCGVFFLSGNRKAIYCSSSCRYAYQKRQWRSGQAKQGMGRPDADGTEGV